MCMPPAMSARRPARAGALALALAVVVSLLLAPPPAGGSQSALQVSTSSQRTGATALHGRTLSGPVYVFAQADKLRSVDFYVDDPQMQGKPFRSVSAAPNGAPFDLVGGTRQAADPLDTAPFAGRSVTVTANMRLNGNRTALEHATFHVAATAAPGPHEPPTSSAPEEPLPEPPAPSAPAVEKFTMTVDGTTVRAAFDIVTTSSTTFRYLQVAVRPSDDPGRPLDLAYHPNTTVDGRRSFSGTATFAPGTYDAWVAYSLDGAIWVDTAPRLRIQVDSTEAPAPASGSRSGLAWPSGVFVGSSPSRAQAFATWRGRPLDVIVDFSARRTWNDVINPAWMYDQWAGTPYQKVYAVAMLPEDGSATMRQCATGAYNDRWRQFGTNIRAKGQDDAIIRLGWEFNGDWFVWSARNPTDFIACWRHIVTNARATAPNLRWDWNPNRGGSQTNGPAAYPGDAYVDIIGIDTYDAWPPARTQTEWNNGQWGQPEGLKYWRDFAIARGKQISIPEWGVWGGNGGGGDNPFYITKMWEFFTTHASLIAYEAYFESRGLSDHRIMGPDAPNPRAGSRYLELFGHTPDDRVADGPVTAVVR
jgi:hypothetical protein